MEMCGELTRQFQSKELVQCGVLSLHKDSYVLVCGVAKSVGAPVV